MHNNEKSPGRAALTMMGADISSLKKSEDKGGVYAYEDGIDADTLKILHDHGFHQTLTLVLQSAKLPNFPTRISASQMMSDDPFVKKRFC